jgi:hypothetical protein
MISQRIECCKCVCAYIDRESKGEERREKREDSSLPMILNIPKLSAAM